MTVDNEAQRRLILEALMELRIGAKVRELDSLLSTIDLVKETVKAVTTAGLTIED